MYSAYLQIKVCLQIPIVVQEMSTRVVMHVIIFFVSIVVSIVAETLYFQKPVINIYGDEFEARKIECRYFESQCRNVSSIPKLIDFTSGSDISTESKPGEDFMSKTCRPSNAPCRVHFTWGILKTISQDPECVDADQNLVYKPAECNLFEFKTMDKPGLIYNKIYDHAEGGAEAAEDGCRSLVAYGFFQGQLILCYSLERFLSGSNNVYTTKYSCKLYAQSCQSTCPTSIATWSSPYTYQNHRSYYVIEPQSLKCEPPQSKSALPCVMWTYRNSYGFSHKTGEYNFYDYLIEDTCTDSIANSDCKLDIVPSPCMVDFQNIINLNDYNEQTTVTPSNNLIRNQLVFLYKKSFSVFGAEWVRFDQVSEKLQSIEYKSTRSIAARHCFEKAVHGGFPNAKCFFLQRVYEQKHQQILMTMNGQRDWYSILFFKDSHINCVVVDYECDNRLTNRCPTNAVEIYNIFTYSQVSQVSQPSQSSESCFNQYANERKNALTAMATQGFYNDVNAIRADHGCNTYDAVCNRVCPPDVGLKLHSEFVSCADYTVLGIVKQNLTAIYPDLNPNSEVYSEYDNAYWKLRDGGYKVKDAANFFQLNTEMYLEIGKQVQIDWSSTPDFPFVLSIHQFNDYHPIDIPWRNYEDGTRYESEEETALYVKQTWDYDIQSTFVTLLATSRPLYYKYSPYYKNSLSYEYNFYGPVRRGYGGIPVKFKMDRTNRHFRVLKEGFNDLNVIVRDWESPGYNENYNPQLSYLLEIPRWRSDNRPIVLIENGILTIFETGQPTGEGIHLTKGEKFYVLDSPLEFVAGENYTVDWSATPLHPFALSSHQFEFREVPHVTQEWSFGDYTTTIQIEKSVLVHEILHNSVWALPKDTEMKRFWEGVPVLVEPCANLWSEWRDGNCVNTGDDTERDDSIESGKFVSGSQDETRQMCFDYVQTLSQEVGCILIIKKEIRHDDEDEDPLASVTYVVDTHFECEIFKFTCAESCPVRYGRSFSTFESPYPGLREWRLQIVAMMTRQRSCVEHEQPPPVDAWKETQCDQDYNTTETKMQAFTTVFESSPDAAATQCKHFANTLNASCVAVYRNPNFGSEVFHCFVIEGTCTDSCWPEYILPSTITGDNPISVCDLCPEVENEVKNALPPTTSPPPPTRTNVTFDDLELDSATNNVSYTFRKVCGEGTGTLAQNDEPWKLPFELASNQYVQSDDYRNDYEEYGYIPQEYHGTLESAEQRCATYFDSTSDFVCVGFLYANPQGSPPDFSNWPYLYGRQLGMTRFYLVSKQSSIAQAGIYRTVNADAFVNKWQSVCTDGRLATHSKIIVYGSNGGLAGEYSGFQNDGREGWQVWDIGYDTYVRSAVELTGANVMAAGSCEQYAANNVFESVINSGSYASDQVGSANNNARVPEYNLIKTCFWRLHGIGQFDFEINEFDTEADMDVLHVVTCSALSKAWLPYSCKAPVNVYSCSGQTCELQSIVTTEDRPYIMFYFGTNANNDRWRLKKDSWMFFNGIISPEFEPTGFKIAWKVSSFTSVPTIPFRRTEHRTDGTLGIQLEYSVLAECDNLWRLGSSNIIQDVSYGRHIDSYQISNNYYLYGYSKEYYNAFTWSWPYGSWSAASLDKEHERCGERCVQWAFDHFKTCRFYQTHSPAYWGGIDTCIFYFVSFDINSVLSRTIDHRQSTFSFQHGGSIARGGLAGDGRDAEDYLEYLTDDYYCSDRPYPNSQGSIAVKTYLVGDVYNAESTSIMNV